MTASFSCHHGHDLQVVDLPVAARDIICPWCGSITKLALAKETKQSGSVDATIDSVGNSDGAQHVKTASVIADSDASRFQTLDHSHAPDDQSSSEQIAQEHFEPPSLPGYHVLEELGRGGMGVVYRARDEAMGREVALKTLQRMSPVGLHLFKQEFRTLADIAHPNLASLYELLSDGQTWCFTMEILDGVEFLDYVWSGFEGPNSKADCLPTSDVVRTSRLSEKRKNRLENALKQLAVGLNALHESGVLHSDIKPSNVLMTKEGRLVLLDFGLAAEMRKQSADEKRLVQGTPTYMAPEQAAGGPLSQASDWYAVGVILYEVLTGRFPFSGNTMQILSRKQMETPLKPDRLAPDTPQHLNDLCMALLDRDPLKRPAAADVLRCVGADAVADEITAHQQTAVVGSVELVGRERHFEVLREALARVSEGDTLSFFVHGKSGMGKSVLVRGFLDSIRRQRSAVVLEGRCYEQESVPFKALDSLIDSLSVYLEELPEGAVQVVMPRDRLALTRVFPVLGRVPEAPNASYPSIVKVDQQELRQRALNALRELLQRLAIREPLVLYIDDLQWGDVDSASLLVDLVRPPDAPRMLLLGSYRSEDVEGSLCLQALAEAYTKGQRLPHRAELAVESLTQAESTELALMLLGQDDDASQTFAKKIAKESGGRPFFVWELVQHVQEDPAIADQSLNLDEVIWARVRRLPEGARRLLELIAVAGRPILTAEAYQALDAVSQGPRSLAQLRSTNFVRTAEANDEATVVETYHDRIRESVCDHLELPRVKAYNLNLALMIERVSGIRVEDLRNHIDSTTDYEEPDRPYELEKHVWQRVFDLAYFFDAAGEHQRAFPFALCAAEQAHKQDAQEVAEQQYRVALRGAAGVSPALRFRVLEGLGDVLVRRGKYDEAREQFGEACTHGVDELVLARLDWKLGEASFKKGDVGGALVFSEKAVKALGEHPPSKLTVLPRALKEAFVQVIHTKFPSQFVGRRETNSPLAKLDLLRARVYDQLTFCYWFSSGMNFVLWSHLRQMNLAERYPPSPELGKTYAFHAVTMTGIPMAERGIRYAERAYQISVNDGDLWGQGMARCYHTFACIVLGRFHEGIKTGEEAVRLLEQAGDVWQSNMARMIGTVPSFHLGDLKTAYRESRKAYDIAVECRDYSGVTISLLFWAPSSPHTIPAGAIEQELKRKRDDPVPTLAAIYARGLELLLKEDNPREAAVFLHDCLESGTKRGVRNVCLFSAATWKATALRIAAERESGASAKRLILRDAKKAVRAALGITKRYKACRPHALREAGQIAAMEGREAYARQCFEESLSVAEHYDARYDLAKTSLAHGEAGLEFGWPDAEQQVLRAKAEIEKIEDVEDE